MSWQIHLSLGINSTELFRSQQWLADPLKQLKHTGLFCLQLKMLFHPNPEVLILSGLFFLLARGTSRNASVLSISVACMEGTASSTGNASPVTAAVSPQLSRYSPQPLTSDQS